MFHKSFLCILRGEDALDKLYHQLTDSGVSAMNFDLLEKNADTIERAAPFLLQSIKREQELIETKKDYYVARDVLTNTYYICYKDVLMLDIDRNDVIDIQSRLEREQDKCFSVYKSRNGYHIFCLSHRFKYRDRQTTEFLLKYDCDFYYTAYAYIRGFSVRLNRKFTENENDEMYSFVGYIGDRSKTDKALQKLVDKHLQFAQRYEHTVNLQNIFSEEV
jgi:hypothetical protein